MAVDRPTFSESWYRICNLRPRLRSTVQVHRQHFRGQMWHVLQDPASNQYFRVNSPAYQFLGILDGKRTVAEAWDICNEQLGDMAPTQGEAVQLMGQLYAANLLHAELPPDAKGLLDRYQKRRAREVKGYLTNLLFIRIPLIDPERFLVRWAGVFGRLFTWYGAILWFALMFTGIYFLIGRVDELTMQSQGILSMSNLPLLYLSMVMIKVCHEFGHAFSCKRFGLVEGTTGEVHVMGIMFLVFAPLPYVDASSASAFRSKWRRAIVGAAGMIVELAIAAIAAIVWSHTSQGSAINAVCYNMMFIASVSTLLFNANPLLRFDGYYILSDLLEIPNLSQRAKEYLYYLVKKFLWGVRRARSSAHTTGERVWFVIYGLASSVYRLFILYRILLFLTDRLPEQFRVVAILFAVVSGAMWLLMPTGKFIKYLATSPELMRVRGRATLTSVIIIASLITWLGIIDTDDHVKLEGIVEPVNMAVIYAGTDGFLESFLETGRSVKADVEVLATIRNPELDQYMDQLRAERNKLETHLHVARTQEPAAAQILLQKIAAIEKQIKRVEGEKEKLSARSPIDGQWIAPNLKMVEGKYIQRGDQIALVADTDNLMIRAVATQTLAAIIEEAYQDVEIRVKGRPDLELTGDKQPVIPAGQSRLPSAALGYAAGGEILTAPDDKQGIKTAEPYFEVRVIPQSDSPVTLLPGQRVVVRFTLPPKPLAAQWYRSLLQVLQRRFHI